MNAYKYHFRFRSERACAFVESPSVHLPLSELRDLVAAKKSLDLRRCRLQAHTVPTVPSTEAYREGSALPDDHTIHANSCTLFLRLPRHDLPARVRLEDRQYRGRVDVSRFSNSRQMPYGASRQNGRQARRGGQLGPRPYINHNAGMHALEAAAAAARAAGYSAG